MKPVILALVLGLAACGKSPTPPVVQKPVPTQEGPKAPVLGESKGKKVGEDKPKKVKKVKAPKAPKKEKKA